MSSGLSKGTGHALWQLGGPCSDPVALYGFLGCIGDQETNEARMTPPTSMAGPYILSEVWPPPGHTAGGNTFF